MPAQRGIRQGDFQVLGPPDTEQSCRFPGCGQQLRPDHLQSDVWPGHKASTGSPIIAHRGTRPETP